jgi:formyl-CoA transferase
MTENSAPLNCLSGVRVLDLTQFEAGPSCTEALAWLGAEVVKVENPEAGEPGRSNFPGRPGADSFYFFEFNANKKSITADLKSERGLALVKELARKADVMIENMAPGTIERLGLGYDVIRAINPGIIYAQVKGFGEGSPYERNLAFDMIAQACGGTMSVTGERDGPPCKPGPSLGDTGTGMLMCISILGALYERRATGQGRRLRWRCRTRCHYIRFAFQRRRRSAGRRLATPDNSGASGFSLRRAVPTTGFMSSPARTIGTACSDSSAARTSATRVTGAARGRRGRGQRDGRRLDKRRQAQDGADWRRVRQVLCSTRWS